MARIRIDDLPRNADISPQEMRRVTGGAYSQPIMSGLGPSTTDPFDIDICKTPPPSSGTPPPTPYPNTTEDGSGDSGGSIDAGDLKGFGGSGS